MSEGQQFATVGRRVAANLVDSVVGTVVMTAGYVLAIVGLINQQVDLVLIGWAVGLVVTLVYSVWILVHQGRKATTPGKSLLGIRMVDADTLMPIGFGRNFARQILLGLAGPLNLIQLFLIGKDPRHQGWHDRAARSVVVPAARLVSRRTAPVAPPVAAQPADHLPEESTVARPVPAPRAPDATTWVLRTAAGDSREVDGKVLVGRDPDQELVDGALGWALDDATLTVSKTHALLSIEESALYVEDWHSTNGVALRRADNDRELAPHQPTALRHDDEILLGDFSLRVSQEVVG